MVKIIRSLAEFTKIRDKEKSPIGFVPTMGNLHQGHISLLEEALKEFNTAYFSIFVNPKQFGPSEDFNKYPRTLDQDIEKIASCLRKYPGKSVVVFAPTSPDEVYLGQNHTISVPEMKDIIEGECRPGHFDGVATVVFRLFEIVRPAKSYFGLKDYQQYLVIKKMAKDLNLPVVVKGMPIIREESGLAMSSRNQYLTFEERTEALVLSQTLQRISAVINGKKENLNKASEMIKEALKDSHWNYLEMRDTDSLSSDLHQANKIVLLGVYQLRTTRLLDNLEVAVQ